MERRAAGISFISSWSFSGGMTLYSLVTAFRLGRSHLKESTGLDEMLADVETVDAFSVFEGTAYVFGMATRAPSGVMEALYTEGRNLWVDLQRRYSH